MLDPLACARLVFDSGRLPHFLAKQSVFKGFAAARCCAAPGRSRSTAYTADAPPRSTRPRPTSTPGNVVVIYPEGTVTRDPDWWPMRARTGVARLALHRRRRRPAGGPVGRRSDVHDYHRKKLHLRFRAPADYLVGEPVDLSAARAQVRDGGPLSAQLLRETTDLIMTRVRDQLAELREEPAPATFAPAAAARARPVTCRGARRDPRRGARRRLVGHDVRQGARRRRQRR